MDKPNVQTKSKSSLLRKPARLARADGASTRTLIIEATRRRLIAQGYANLNLRDIAAEAGVNHALIGYHFRGKQPLVLAVLDDANARLLARQADMYAHPTKGISKRRCKRWHCCCSKWRPAKPRAKERVGRHDGRYDTQNS